MPQPVTPLEVEAAYLRRLKAAGAEVGPPPDTELPQTLEGQPIAVYRVDQIQVTVLYGGQDFAYATAGEPDTGVLLRRDDQRAVIAAVPVRRDRPQRGATLMTTPLAELDLKDAAWNRALCAWAAWLTSQG